MKIPRLSDLGVLSDPAGEDHLEQSRLRRLGKWRFVLLRGIAGFSVPMFLWLAATNLSDDIKSARFWHGSILLDLFQAWVAGFCISAFLGAVVGFLAWRRITSDVWPGDRPDPESSITRLGSIGSSEK
jgi:hypothetical protein